MEDYNRTLDSLIDSVKTQTTTNPTLLPLIKELKACRDQLISLGLPKDYEERAFKGMADELVTLRKELSVISYRATDSRV